MGDNLLDLDARQAVAQAGGRVHRELCDGAEADKDGDDHDRTVAAAELRRRRVNVLIRQLIR